MWWGWSSLSSSRIELIQLNSAHKFAGCSTTPARSRICTRRRRTQKKPPRGPHHHNSTLRLIRSSSSSSERHHQQSAVSTAFRAECLRDEYMYMLKNYRRLLLTRIFPHHVDVTRRRRAQLCPFCAGNTTFTCAPGGWWFYTTPRDLDGCACFLAAPLFLFLLITPAHATLLCWLCVVPLRTLTRYAEIAQSVLSNCGHIVVQYCDENGK